MPRKTPPERAQSMGEQRRKQELRTEIREAGQQLKAALADLRQKLEQLTAIETSFALMASAQHQSGNLVTVHDAKLGELRRDVEAIARFVGFELGLQGGGSEEIEDTLDAEAQRERRGL
jgi:hypothetical protein